MTIKIALLLLHSLSVADAYSANLALRRPLSPLRALPARAARARPPATMLLPGVLAPVAPTAAAGYKVALTVGGAAVALHVGLVQLINRLPEKRRPAILARTRSAPPATRRKRRRRSCASGSTRLSNSTAMAAATSTSASSASCSAI